MLAIYSFVTIIVCLLLIITKRLSVITALVLVPVFIAFIASFDNKQIGYMALTGIKLVVPTGILLMN
jgi:CitMHS family citrate-Mg2+:H+ or citrate-Ca2+:H+ symporter